MLSNTTTALGVGLSPNPLFQSWTIHFQTKRATRPFLVAKKGYLFDLEALAYWPGLNIGPSLKNCRRRLAAVLLETRRTAAVPLLIHPGYKVPPLSQRRTSDLHRGIHTRAARRSLEATCLTSIRVCNRCGTRSRGLQIGSPRHLRPSTPVLPQLAIARSGLRSEARHRGRYSLQTGTMFSGA